MNILLTGATGYIGGRLIPKLLEAGHNVRVLVRDASRVKGRSWSSQVQIVTGDLIDKKFIEPALEEMDVAYYLVHSMLSGDNFEELDRIAAQNFASAAKNAKLKKIIYLGGLLPKSEKISKHLRSRAEVGEILAASVPTTEFRAGPIIGSGSASFEMLRYLTERLPIMIAPKWIKNEIQPISVRDVLFYLISALTIPPAGIVEIGTDILTFKKMMLVFAEIRGFKRTIIPVPVLAPGLASRWVGLVTPIPNSIAVPIIKGITRPLLADLEKARALFPNIHPISYKTAVELALNSLKKGKIQTRWSMALGQNESLYKLQSQEGMIREVRKVKVKTNASRVFQTFMQLGGQRGWLVWNWAWRIRGFLDRIVGGPGLRRGRRQADELFVGESMDFWRIEEVEKNRLLRLRAEMKLPGRAWLLWEVFPDDQGCEIKQTALFAPKGLSGFAYWYLLYPLHALIFSDMVHVIAREAEKNNEYDVKVNIKI